MAVPKKRRSYMRRHTRRAHHALKSINLSPCPNCKEPALPHRACPSCHTYKGKRVVNVED